MSTAQAIASPRGHTSVYRFEDRVLRLRTYELIVHGRLRPLEPKPFGLLLLLVEARPNVVHREAIFRELWPGISVSDGALTQCVWQARRALAEDADGLQLIRTVRNVGYRFVADVSEE